jgi:uncharacterized membrane protein YphA (DoxX/SURF4 family)
MDWLYLIGRVLFALIFVMSGYGHLTQSASMAQYAGSKGVPAPRAMVLISGLMILGGGLSVLLGVWMEIGTWLLVFFLVPAALKMHNFWAVTDPMQKAVQQAQFMKNISMAGAALILYWVIQSYGYGPFTLGQPM